MKARLLDDQIRMLAWTVDRGLHAGDILRALRGVDSWFNAKRRRKVFLPTSVQASRLFGVNPAATLTQVEESLARLAEAGVVVENEAHRWRDVGNVTREANRRAQAALAASAAVAP